MRSFADISADGLYRYTLTRCWDEAERYALFIMLNPSTADATKDDPTIRRCVGFAKREGCAGIRVVNLYALRATKPADLWCVNDPVGPENGDHLRRAISHAALSGSPIIAAWGANAKPFRVYAVKQMPGMEQAKVLGFTTSGAPRHPLYVKRDAPLLPLSGDKP